MKEITDVFTLARLTLAIALSISTSVQADRLSEKRVDELLQELRPDPDSAYLSVPWNTSLLDAQRQAARAGKPIFIWAMDGHPLGCT